MVQAEELRAKSDDELNSRILELKKEQFNLRFQTVSGQLENTAQYRRARQEIAQIKTILHQRVET